jgi:hypothetical protein
MRKRILFLLAVVVPAHVTSAANWTGNSGLWSDRNNWSPAGVPASGGTARIGHSDSLVRNITLDHSYASPLAAFTLDQTGSGHTTVTMTTPKIRNLRARHRHEACGRNESNNEVGGGLHSAHSKRRR